MALGRKKKTEQPAQEQPALDITPILYMLEAVRLALMARVAGAGTLDGARLASASEALAQRALKGG